MLSTTTYRDNNNFLQINTGEYNDERFNLFIPEKSFFFVDYIFGPVWTGKHYESYRNRC